MTAVLAAFIVADMDADSECSSNAGIRHPGVDYSRPGLTDYGCNHPPPAHLPCSGYHDRWSQGHKGQLYSSGSSPSTFEEVESLCLSRSSNESSQYRPQYRSLPRPGLSHVLGQTPGLLPHGKILSRQSSGTSTSTTSGNLPEQSRPTGTGGSPYEERHVSSFSPGQQADMNGHAFVDSIFRRVLEWNQAYAALSLGTAPGCGFPPMVSAPLQSSPAHLAPAPPWNFAPASFCSFPAGYAGSRSPCPAPPPPLSPRAGTQPRSSPVPASRRMPSLNKEKTLSPSSDMTHVRKRRDLILPDEEDEFAFSRPSNRKQESIKHSTAGGQNGQPHTTSSLASKQASSESMLSSMSSMSQSQDLSWREQFDHDWREAQHVAWRQQADQGFGDPYVYPWRRTNPSHHFWGDPPLFGAPPALHPSTLTMPAGQQMHGRVLSRGMSIESMASLGMVSPSESCASPYGSGSQNPAEMMLMNLGFGGSAEGFLPERFLRDWYSKMSQTPGLYPGKPPRPQDSCPPLYNNMTSPHKNHGDREALPSKPHYEDLRSASDLQLRISQPHYQHGDVSAFQATDPLETPTSLLPPSLGKESRTDRLKEYIEAYAQNMSNTRDARSVRIRQFACSRQKSLPSYLETLTEEDEVKSRNSWHKPQVGECRLQAFLREDSLSTASGCSDSQWASSGGGSNDQSLMGSESDSLSGSDHVDYNQRTRQPRAVPCEPSSGGPGPQAQADPVTCLTLKMPDPAQRRARLKSESRHLDGEVPSVKENQSENVSPNTVLNCTSEHQHQHSSLSSLSQHVEGLGGPEKLVEDMCMLTCPKAPQSPNRKPKCSSSNHRPMSPFLNTTRSDTGRTNGVDQKCLGHNSEDLLSRGDMSPAGIDRNRLFVSYIPMESPVRRLPGPSDIQSFPALSSCDLQREPGQFWNRLADPVGKPILQSSDSSTSKINKYDVNQKPGKSDSLSSTESLEVADIFHAFGHSSNAEFRDPSIVGDEGLVEPAMISIVLEDVDGNLVDDMDRLTAGSRHQQRHRQQCQQRVQQDDHLQIPSSSSSTSLSPVPLSPVTVIEVSLDNQQDSIDTEESAGSSKDTNDDDEELCNDQTESDQEPLNSCHDETNNGESSNVKDVDERSSRTEMCSSPISFEKMCKDSYDARDTRAGVREGSVSPVLLFSAVSPMTSSSSSPSLTPLASKLSDVSVQADDGKLSPLVFFNQEDFLPALQTDGVDNLYQVSDRAVQCDGEELQEQPEPASQGILEHSKQITILRTDTCCQTKHLVMYEMSSQTESCLQTNSSGDHMKAKHISTPVHNLLLFDDLNLLGKHRGHSGGGSTGRLSAFSDSIPSHKTFLNTTRTQTFDSEFWEYMGMDIPLKLVRAEASTNSEEEHAHLITEEKQAQLILSSHKAKERTYRSDRELSSSVPADPNMKNATAMATHGTMYKEGCTQNVTVSNETEPRAFHMKTMPANSSTPALDQNGKEVGKVHVSQLNFYVGDYRDICDISFVSRRQSDSNIVRQAHNTDHSKITGSISDMTDVVTDPSNTTEVQYVNTPDSYNAAVEEYAGLPHNGTMEEMCPVEAYYVDGSVVNQTKDTDLDIDSGIIDSPTSSSLVSHDEERPHVEQSIKNNLNLNVMRSTLTDAVCSPDVKSSEEARELVLSKFLLRSSADSKSGNVTKSTKCIAEHTDSQNESGSFASRTFNEVLIQSSERRTEDACFNLSEQGELDKFLHNSWVECHTYKQTYNSDGNSAEEDSMEGHNQETDIAEISDPGETLGTSFRTEREALQTAALGRLLAEGTSNAHCDNAVENRHTLTRTPHAAHRPTPNDRTPHVAFRPTSNDNQTDKRHLAAPMVTGRGNTSISSANINTTANADSLDESGYPVCPIDRFVAHVLRSACQALCQNDMEDKLKLENLESETSRGHFYPGKKNTAPEIEKLEEQMCFPTTARVVGSNISVSSNGKKQGLLPAVSDNSPELSVVQSLPPSEVTEAVHWTDRKDAVSAHGQSVHQTDARGAGRGETPAAVFSNASVLLEPEAEASVWCNYSFYPFSSKFKDTRTDLRNCLSPARSQSADSLDSLRANYSESIDDILDTLAADEIAVSHNKESNLTNDTELPAGPDVHEYPNEVQKYGISQAKIISHIVQSQSDCDMVDLPGESAPPDSICSPFVSEGTTGAGDFQRVSDVTKVTGKHLERRWCPSQRAVLGESNMERDSWKSSVGMTVACPSLTDATLTQLILMGVDHPDFQRLKEQGIFMDSFDSSPSFTTPDDEMASDVEDVAVSGSPPGGAPSVINQQSNVFHVLSGTDLSQQLCKQCSCDDCLSISEKQKRFESRKERDVQISYNRKRDTHKCDEKNFEINGDSTEYHDGEIKKYLELKDDNITCHDVELKRSMELKANNIKLHFGEITRDPEVKAHHTNGHEGEITRDLKLKVNSPGCQGEESARGTGFVSQETEGSCDVNGEFGLLQFHVTDPTQHSFREEAPAENQVYCSTSRDLDDGGVTWDTYDRKGHRAFTLTSRDSEEHRHCWHPGTPPDSDKVSTQTALSPLPMKRAPSPATAGEQRGPVPLDRHSLDDRNHHGNVDRHSLDDRNHHGNVDRHSLDDRNHHGNVDSHSLDDRNHHGNVDSHSLDDRNHHGNVDSHSLDDRNHHGNVDRHSLDDRNHHGNVDSHSLDDRNHHGNVDRHSLDDRNHHGNVDRHSLDDRHHHGHVDSHSLDDKNHHGHVAETHHTDVTDTHCKDVTDAHDTDVTDTHCTDVTDTHCTDVTDTHYTDVSDAYCANVTDTYCTDETDAHCTDVTDTHYTDVTNTQHTDASNTQHTHVTETQRTDLTDTHYKDVIDTHNTNVTDTHYSDVTDTHYTDVTSTQHTDLNDTQHTDVTDTHDLSVVQTQARNVAFINSSDVSFDDCYYRPISNSTSYESDHFTDHVADTDSNDEVHFTCSSDSRRCAWNHNPNRPSKGHDLVSSAEGSEANRRQVRLQFLLSHHPMQSGRKDNTDIIDTTPALTAAEKREAYNRVTSDRSGFGISSSFSEENLSSPPLRPRRFQRSLSRESSCSDYSPKRTKRAVSRSSPNFNTGQTCSGNSLQVPHGGESLVSKNTLIKRRRSHTGADNSLLPSCHSPIPDSHACSQQNSPSDSTTNSHTCVGTVPDVLLSPHHHSPTSRAPSPIPDVTISSVNQSLELISFASSPEGSSRGNSPPEDHPRQSLIQSPAKIQTTVFENSDSTRVLGGCGRVDNHANHSPNSSAHNADAVYGTQHSEHLSPYRYLESSPKPRSPRLTQFRALQKFQTISSPDGSPEQLTPSIFRSHSSSGDEAGPLHIPVSCTFYSSKHTLLPHPRARLWAAGDRNSSSTESPMPSTPPLSRDPSSTSDSSSSHRDSQSTTSAAMPTSTCVSPKSPTLESIQVVTAQGDDSVLQTNCSKPFPDKLNVSEQHVIEPSNINTGVQSTAEPVPAGPLPTWSSEPDPLKALHLRRSRFQRPENSFSLQQHSSSSEQSSFETDTSPSRRFFWASGQKTVVSTEVPSKDCLLGDSIPQAVRCTWTSSDAGKAGAATIPTPWNPGTVTSESCNSSSSPSDLISSDTSPPRSRPDRDEEQRQ